MDNESENDQFATGQSDNAQFATEQGVAQSAPGSESEEKGPVPYDRFDEVNQQRKQAEDESQRLAEENRRYQEQLLAAANPSQTQEKDVFDGLEGYENPTVDQIRQSQSKQAERQAQQTQQLLTNIQLNNFVTANPDFSTVVGTYDRTGRLISAKPLKELMKDIPSMRVLESLPATAAPYVYEMAKQHKELKELQAQQAAVNEHQAGVENKLAPLSPASVGGGGGAPTTEPTDDQVDAAWEAAERGDFG